MSFLFPFTLQANSIGTGIGIGTATATATATASSIDIGIGIGIDIVQTNQFHNCLYFDDDDDEKDDDVTETVKSQTATRREGWVTNELTKYLTISNAYKIVSILLFKPLLLLSVFSVFFLSFPFLYILL